jgi:regulation of enolase protein 1 (concanavalin A-like superfamily)
MPMLFDNSKSPFYSEATQTFASLQDWTGNGANTLSLWVRGQPAAFVDKGNGAFTVGASGHDIWDAADDFRFVYKKLSGDGSIIVKVDSLGGSTNTWAKAGVMIRTTLTDGSPMVDMVLANPNGANGANFQWRATTGAGASNTNSPSTPNIKTPQWVKLTRKGNVFSGQYSADGVTWLDIKNPALTGTPVTTTINMPADVYIGLCVTSHDRTQTAVAEFSGVATTGNVTGAWQQAWIGDDPDLTMDLARLYVIVEDSAGKSATATNATLANASAWTQWSIPFSDLTGVNLAKVKKLTLGVGDKKNPAADGSGRVFIDDIRVIKP